MTPRRQHQHLRLTLARSACPVSSCLLTNATASASWPWHERASKPARADRAHLRCRARGRWSKSASRRRRPPVTGWRVRLRGVRKHSERMASPPPRDPGACAVGPPELPPPLRSPPSGALALCTPPAAAAPAAAAPPPLPPPGGSSSAPLPPAAAKSCGVKDSRCGRGHTRTRAMHERARCAADPEEQRAHRRCQQDVNQPPRRLQLCTPLCGAARGPAAAPATAAAAAAAAAERRSGTACAWPGRGHCRSACGGAAAPPWPPRRRRHPPPACRRL